MTQSPVGMRDCVDILGIAVDRISMADAVQRIAGFIRRDKEAVSSGVARPPLAHVVTMNSEIAMMAVEDPKVAEILAKAALVTPDGIGVVWAAQLQGQPVPERVPGIDMMGQVLGICEQEGWRPFFLGAAPGVAEEAYAALQRRYPRLQLAGLHHGYFKPEETPAILDGINNAKPDILLVALGAPRQEKWIDMHRNELQVPVAVGVGGSLDGWAGRVKRAPQWMCNSGLEWAYRLVRQPSRALRMTALPKFAATVLWRKLRRG